MNNAQLGTIVAVVTLALTVPPVILAIIEYANNKEQRELDKQLTVLNIQAAKARIAKGDFSA